MDWTLRILDNHWRVFRSKITHAHLSQKGHTWIRVMYPDIVYHNRSYKCECGYRLHLSKSNRFIAAYICDQDGNIILNKACSEVKMNTALE